MLVVVLIIGILAAVALPQYQKAVEKARFSEALVNIHTLQQSVDAYRLEHGIPSTLVDITDMLPVKVSSNNFSYSAYYEPEECFGYGGFFVEGLHNSEIYSLSTSYCDGKWIPVWCGEFEPNETMDGPSERAVRICEMFRQMNL